MKDNTQKYAPSSPNGDLVNEWVNEAYPLLRQSLWKPALDIQGVDVLETLRSPISTSLLHIARDNHNEYIKTPFYAKIKILPKWGAVGLKHLIQDKKACISSNKIRPAQIVFWPREPTHVKAQLPVAAALEQLGINSIFVACQPTIFTQLKMQGVNTIFPRGTWPRSLNGARRIAKSRSNYLIADPGVVLPVFPKPCKLEHVINALRWTIRTWLPIVHETITTTNLLVDDVSPIILIVGNDITLEGRSAILRAKLLGINTVCLMHGAAIGPLHHYHIVDKLLVYGQRHFDQFISYGLEPGQVIVTGAPNLDSCPQQIGHVHPHLRARLNLNNETPWILIATSGPGYSISHHHHLMFIETIMRLSVMIPDVIFVAKLHRKDRLDYYKQVAQNIPTSRLIIVPHGKSGYPTDIFDWLHGCPIVVTGASTVGLEALIMGVPVITVDFANELHGVDLIESDATIHVKTSEELERAIVGILNKSIDLAKINKRSIEFLKDQFFRLDGQSAKRCAHVIAALGGLS